MPEVWRQATLSVPEEDSQFVQQVLLNLGALGLEIKDDESLNVPEKDYKLKHEAVITGTFDKTPDLEARILERLSGYEIHFGDLVDGDWANEFLKSWRAFSLGDNIWIVPSWDHDFKADKNALVLKIDPGMAFGTGHHETTTLCARAVLAEVASGKKHVLDVGTGTGILAMIAAKAGALEIIGTDNDPLACEVARENLAKNNFDFEISLQEPDAFGPRFDLVVANILANPLIELAPQIIKALTPGGVLLLSGILATQAQKVQDAYETLGLKHQETTQMGDWVLISFKSLQATN
ncbi:MAG: 50S ribosomal protein L11 methyltransferase [Myxococcaceae bacterium]